ncbi:MULTISPECIES: sensor histidine kinase [unclassified Roseofilum]|uniref:sensor histidine kinase n=1 Tax=unclassified Roseofilum TaxID=2620099 RepID=UPI000E7D6B56|nr:MULTISPECIES: response regulator [unclassified Roseofilum]MBP0011304.1 response regulator [Roseofilum sp. Belize Diploria]MBP0035785.1 response regulator [Roseofilum sp. Belize BBD 4]HBQ98253.1 hybrid sensor histidine kinase/response regulator [Cyanobacteria bacterium UBA11691]
MQNKADHQPEILAVDDTPANLQVVADTLSPAGYIVAAVTSGERALKRLQTYVPDLILLDIQMPGMDGFETCRQIKDNPNTASIPIIFITALSDDKSIIKGFDLGAVDYITKPFREAEMLARVKTHLQLGKLRANLEKQVEQRTTDLTQAIEKLRSSQMQLVQQEKMAGLGNLVAGVAHEINNPLSFITGNITMLKDTLVDLLAIIQAYRQEYPEPSPDLAEEIENADLDFLLEDIPKILVSMQQGVKRIANISTSLRTFSRADTDIKTEFNVHEGLDSTLLILKYRLKANEQRPAIKIVKNYGDIPELKCYPGQLNQVFMNILANAIDTLDEKSKNKSFEEIEKDPNYITVTTDLSEKKQDVVVRIIDNGMGMPESVKAKIFEQGFTTKKVGKGTGLGMAIACEILTKKHCGKITCSSQLGQGTEFVISLPLG